MMPHDCGALISARPVAACGVGVARDGAALWRRSGQHVVLVHRIAASGNHCALFGEGGLLVEIVGCAVKVADTLSDHDTRCIAPRTCADSVSRVHGFRTRRAQVCVPGVIARTCRLSQILAMPVGAGKPAKVSAFSAADAGDEKCHRAAAFRADLLADR